MADEETTEENIEETPAEAQEPVAETGGEGAGDAEAIVVEEEPAAPEPVVHPKERRRIARSRHTGEHLPQRGPEERQAEREAVRARKAAERRQERAKKREERAAKPAAPAAPVQAAERVVHNPKVRQGIVVSDKADKTITVRVDVSRRHRRYKKIVRSSKTLHAHDERNEANEGDLVRVIEARPLSRTKRWRLTEVLERAR
jgi:small subunit ribosomal protein S17